MPTIGQIEKKTQARVVKLFREQLNYDYLGDWTDRSGFEGKGNRNIEPEYLTAWLKKQGVDDALIARALHLLEKTAGDTSKSLYDREDVAGLLENRLGKARERLNDALEAVRALCEPVEAPRDSQAFFRYFSSKESGNAAQLKASEPQRLSLYTLTASLVRAYADIASEMTDAGYGAAETEEIRKEVAFYENLRSEVKQHSGDAIDLKQYEPAMRHLIDTYIRAEESEKISAFDDLSLVRAELRALLELGLSDVYRRFSQPEKDFSWWDYRLFAFRRNLGLRIDLLLTSFALTENCDACHIDKEPRTWERPSDHAPVVGDFRIPA